MYTVWRFISDQYLKIYDLTDLDMCDKNITMLS